MIMALKICGPLRRVYIHEQKIHVRVGRDLMEFSFDELESLVSPFWAPHRSLGVTVVELRFTRETPRILMVVRDQILIEFESMRERERLREVT